MALIVLTSASGSPGVTATALGLALTWARPVLLVEADPTGGSSILAGYLRGRTAPTDSLIELALAHREGRLGEALAQATIGIEGTEVSLLPGTRSHTQARALAPLWQPLTAVLKGLERTGQDVIVDAGRLGLAGWPEPLLYAADLCLITTRSDLVSLSGARSWAETLRAGFESVGGASSLGLLMVGQGEPYGPREVRKVLQVPVTATVAWDEPAARVFAKGGPAPRRFDSCALVRSLKGARAGIETAVAAGRAELSAPAAGRPM